MSKLKHGDLIVFDREKAKGVLCIVLDSDCCSYLRPAPRYIMQPLNHTSFWSCEQGWDLDVYGGIHAPSSMHNMKLIGNYIPEEEID